MFDFIKSKMCFLRVISIVFFILIIVDAAEAAVPSLPQPEQTLSLPAPASAESKVLKVINTAFDKLRYTHYRFGGSYFNTWRGIYELDCSGYVDALLRKSNLQAFNSLANFSKTDKPSSSDYYSFFNHIPYHHSLAGWYHLEKVNELRAGDILVYRSLHSRFRRGGGHVMIVAGPPQPDPLLPDVYYVRVSDSALSGHSDDTRNVYKSGIGIGTLLLKTDAMRNRPIALAWKADAAWQHALDIAMARPIS